MPTTVPIDVFQIGKTQVNRDEVRRWLDFLGANECPVPEEDAITNPALLVAMAAKRCYKSFVEGLNPNVTRIRREYAEYLDNVLASGHGSVMEHAVYTYAIENVSRVFTGEMNRHRAGWAISEGSMRYIRYENMPYWLPNSIKGEDVLSEDQVTSMILDEFNGTRGLTRGGTLELTVEVKKQLSRAVFQAAFEGTENWYALLQTIWHDELQPDSKFAGKKQITSMMRRIVGMGVATGGVWTGNIRALRHVLTMRTSPAAEEEICYVFSRVARHLAVSEPMLFGDFEEDEHGFWHPKYVKV